MSDAIQHECGVALIRLLKPVSYYQKKYGTWRYGLNKLYLLLEKQHNRGQDGAGIANLKLDLDPGTPYIYRHRSNQREPIRHVFELAHQEMAAALEKFPLAESVAEEAYRTIPYSGELFLGHLRYGTFGRNNLDSVHPVIRANNWKSRSLVLAGNFNLTNVDELYQSLLKIGQHPVDYSDTVTILERVGHFLDVEVETLYRQYKAEGYKKSEITPLIASNLKLSKILTRASKKWDGGYVIAGMTGQGDCFVMRDPWGIRPAYVYRDDEVVVAASERPVIQTVFNVESDRVTELEPGHALIVNRDGLIHEEEVREPQERCSCSFERIYFSRGSDESIYRERKMLGRLLVPGLLKELEGDLENTVFSYIPNTAESAFFGMIEGLDAHLLEIKKRAIREGIAGQALDHLLEMKPRVEKIAIKDAKLRTFITQDQDREDLIAHVYDITYGTIRKGADSLVVIDDSIVRGTTLKRSIIRILDRLGPKRILVVSSSPQIRYPDCYGIDMAKLGDFIAFRAAIELLKDRGMDQVIRKVYEACLDDRARPKEEIINHVKEIYRPFSDQEISEQIARMMHTPEIRAEIRVLYQTVDDLHRACPNDLGDWYFTGNYPTPGGNKVANQSFINYFEGRDERGY
ncbi:MAG: amidophosphoribosyltransferase [Bacteroidales bacterium]|nr:amidophosphoribosyltransferase [Bacteroidales bacterium]MDD2569586.1 amidophosphoribosyltransferase [Bacteroidales bacterium]MDD2813281.1 amidophosphoribosyltransferase [Bacteroidales bacterium]MDD3385685.1 amidophosphoribosyltransferase [Bacteroidales bacterium]MDD4813762.1 amidophosphoribosyltransferase [Bacteroidales bacterium]